MENYVLYEELGRGTYSVVYKGRKKGSVEYVAVNCAEKVKRRELQNIVRLTHELSHPNIVTFYEWYETTNHIWMIVELCTGQNLAAMLEKDGCFPEATVRGFGIDIVNGLHYLHSLGILYCDLRTSKLILDGPGKVKLSNFSLAKVEEEEEILEIEDRDDGEEYRRPSPIYMAPEVLQGEPHSVSSDLWSLACVLFELFTGNPPFVADSFSKLVTMVINENFLYPLQTIDGVEMGLSDNFYDLLQSLSCKDAGSRPTWSQLLLHPLWDGSLQLGPDGETGRSEQTEMMDVGIEREEKEVIKDGDVSVSEKTKVSLGSTTVVRKNNTVSQIKGNDRPITAPESGGIKHGTYRVEEIRPHTTESASVKKKEKLAKDQKPRQTAVSSFGKLNTGTPKQNHQVKHDFGSVHSESSMASRVDCKQEHRGMKTDKMFAEVGGSGSPDNLNVERLLYHPSDFIVSSIIDNPKIKKLVVPKWDAKAIGISSLTVEQILEQGEDETAKHFVEICKLLEQRPKSAGAPGAMGQRSKLHISSYLASILHNTDVANMVANSSVVPSLLQLLKQCSSADLKGRLGFTLGILASNATLIADEFNMNEVFVILTETIRDNFRNARLKQSLLPCLGEFLFYAATQEETEGKVNENWEAPSVTCTIIIKCLREGEDSIVQHYAAKTIENIATTDTHHCEKFATTETAQMLWNLFTHCSGDAQKLTAISALCRLTRHTVGLFQHVIDKAGLHMVLNCLVSGVTKVQQAIITMLAALVSKGVHTKRLIEDKELIHKMMAFLDSPSIVIRGKAFVAVAAMSRDHHVALLHCCQYKLVTYIERDNKRQTPTKTDGALVTYLKDCLRLCIKTVHRCVPEVVQSMIHALEAVSGRRHPSAAQSKELRSCIPLMSIVLHLVTSGVFRHSVVNESFLRDMGLLVAHVKSIDAGTTCIGSAAGGAPGADELTNVVLSIVEAVAQHPALVLQHRALVVGSVLPQLAAMTSSRGGDVRMFCFKMFADVASVLLDSEAVCDDGSDSTQLLTEVITSQLLPQYDTILQDQDPLPSYALKLLLAFLEHSPRFSETIVDKGIVASLGDILDRHGGDVAGPVVQTIVSLLDCLVSSSSGTDLWPLYEQGLVDHVTSLFVTASSSINEKNPERNFSEILLPLLDTVHGIMKYASKSVRKAFQAKSAGDETASSLTSRAERILLEGKPLVELTGVLIQFLCHEDADIREWSLRCLYQVVELYGGAYEEAMSVENMECLAHALLHASDAKRQKQVLWIVRRFVSSNTWHAAALKERGDVLLEAMVEITKVHRSSEETAAVKTMVVEITKATGIA